MYTSILLRDNKVAVIAYLENMVEILIYMYIRHLRKKATKRQSVKNSENIDMCPSAY